MPVEQGAEVRAVERVDAVGVDGEAFQGPGDVGPGEHGRRGREIARAAAGA